MSLVALILESLLTAVILPSFLIVTLSPAVMFLTAKSALPVMFMDWSAVKSTALELIVPVMSLSEVTFKVSPTVAVLRLRLSVVSVKFFDASIVTDLLPVFISIVGLSRLSPRYTLFGILTNSEVSNSHFLTSSSVLSLARLTLLPLTLTVAASRCRGVEAVPMS